MDARMANVRLRIQVDFGVGDIMVPGPRAIEYPALLNGDTIQLLAYPIETAIAEKLEAMVALGNANSRMKDFYDVWTCSQHLNLDKKLLLKAIVATFEHRGTPLPVDDFEALSPSFVDDHQLQWNAFVRKIGEEALKNKFGKIVADLRSFIAPLVRSHNG